MNGLQILSEITTNTKYSKYLLEKQRRETSDELFDRNRDMFIQKYPELREEIKAVYEEYVKTRKVMPAMRTLQFAGAPIFQNESRTFNCSFMHVSSPEAFAETMFLSLGGTGVGYSVQKQHVKKLPKLKRPSFPSKKFLVEDSIIGWAEAVRVLVESYFYGKQRIEFIFDQIRPKGTPLKTAGGKAPGPEPLIECIRKLTAILDNASFSGRRLKPIECHDMMCHIADSVLAGGIRRSSLIAIFSLDDMDMLTCKSGEWWENNLQRSRANNSVVLLKDTPWDGTFRGLWKYLKRRLFEKPVTFVQFLKIWKIIQESGSGEPGIMFTNDLDMGINPCVEISLLDCQMCNLTETNASDVETQQELEARVRAAAFLGTLQAGFTDFIYLRKKWRDNCEEEALLGVSLTGIGSGKVLTLDLERAAKVVLEENKRVADIIGISPTARATCVKPSGTAACVLMCSSGIHAWHNEHYIRRIQVNKNEGIYSHILKQAPELVEDLISDPINMAVISIPIKAPENAILRTEGVMNQLKRVLDFNRKWVKPGHVRGENRHNVSSTIYVKDDEWEKVGRFFWDNREDFTGMSVLPYDGGTYKQTPFEDITEEKYEELCVHLAKVNLENIVEYEDTTHFGQEAACAGGQCSL